jgi:Fibronectin type III domain
MEVAGMRESGQAASRRPRRRLGFVVTALAAALVAVQSGATTSHAVSGPTWWKVDLHEHSAFSGDARADIGVDAAKAKLQNYNAVFLTDHDRGSGFQIGGDNGNKITATEQLNGNWISKLLPTNLPSGSSGILPTAVQSPSPVHSGTYSIHVKATASTSTTVRSMSYNPRGMGLRSGAITLDFWAYPTATSGSAGLDVSVALGGDATTGPTPFGYTTADGTTHTTKTGAGKTTVLAWELGGARAAVTNGPNDSNVFANALSFTPNTWNHYVINVTTGQVQWTPQGGSTTTTGSTGLNQLPASLSPADYDVLTYVKMEAAATSTGTAEGYFDDFHMSVASPQCTSTEFVYRNSLLSALAGTNSAGGQFVMFPGREMGQNNHSNQFNFGITSTSQYKDTFTDTTQDDNAICSAVNNPSAQWQFSRLGTDNIPDVQASGYPAQDNHPGVTDTVSDVVAHNAFGADAVEARTGQDYSNPSNFAGDAWDQILMKNVVIMGTQGSDAHEGATTATPSMYIDAPALTLDDLMHGYFEGRMYGAPGNFAGTVVFNLDGSASPYPARYPVYVPASQTSANVHLTINGGIGTTQRVRWIYSNAGATPNVTDLAAGPTSYNASRTIPLSGAFTYVRAAVITPGSAAPTAVNTEPIFFRSVNGMPAGMNARIDSITPPTGTCSCTIAMTKGITSATYSNSTLTLALNDPVGSGVEMLVQSPMTPLGVRVDGSSVSAASSLSAYQSGTGNSWFYDSGSSMLYVRDHQASTSSTVAVDYSGGGGDVTPPSVPTGVNGSPVGSSEVDLSWTASTDNVGGSGVAGYNVYRDGTQVNGSPITSTSFNDTGLQPATQYSYTVSAVDNQGNESAQSSPPKQVTTGSSGGGGGGGGTFSPSADSYVDSSAPSTNYGSNVKLRVDTSPTVNSYLRFNVSGVSGSVTGVTLKVFATSNLAAGFEVHALSDDTWGESTINSSNAPAPGALLATSGAATANSYVTVTLPPSAVSGNGDVNFVLVGRSTTALALSSGESANPPQLVITTS